MKRAVLVTFLTVIMSVFIACGNDSDNESVQIPENIDISSNTKPEQEDVIVGAIEIADSGETCWVSESTINFRKTPSTDGEVIGQLTKGTEILKIGEEGEWLHIRCGENTGYIHKDYAKNYPQLNPENGEVSIVVKKGERLLELWQGETLVDSFPIGLGRSPEGHKQVEGDSKTPEGEYYVCVRNSNSSFYLSLGISYPNKEDAAEALADGRIDQATYESIAYAIDHGQCPDWNTPLGGAIMIHGCGGSSDWTLGCIAVDNEVMDMLFEYCPIGTKITILP